MGAGIAVKGGAQGFTIKGGKPYGASLVSVLLAAAAYVCSVTATFTCYYVTITQRDGLGDISGVFARGIWYGQDNEQDKCGSYSGSIDASWKSARAFGVITTILGSFAMMGVLGLYAAPPQHIRKTMISMGGVCFNCALFQGLTLLMLNSNACDGVDCGLDDGANLTIAAIVLWFIAGCCMAPTPDEMQILQEEQKRLMGLVDEEEGQKGGEGDEAAAEEAAKEEAKEDEGAGEEVEA